MFDNDILQQKISVKLEKPSPTFFGTSVATASILAAEPDALVDFV